ncbi:MAG: type II toxin-antitoxin system antitoxin, RelB/DinJ family, partial [Lachnospiraceae bacterium]|nr:type II toxin-antitoxin system antitoxin, RelB/DinJ family [Lachnospiraceae bacterium]
VLIDSLYRQIIMTKSIPYSLSIPTVQTRDMMTEAQFDEMMEKGLDQAKSGQGLDIDEAFDRIMESI